ncbi:MAG: hypothetical protein HQK93_07595 [Nitrospirae bacterium]|nr:hypothetical protein [Nitrospirota bacterium]
MNRYFLFIKIFLYLIMFVMSCMLVDSCGKKGKLIPPVETYNQLNKERIELCKIRLS